MTALFILVLFVVAACLVYCKYKRASAVIFIIALMSFFIIGNGLLSGLLLKRLQSPYPILTQPAWAQRNAIVLLGGGAIKVLSTGMVKPLVMAYSRIVETTRLYRLCKKAERTCVVVVSGGDALAAGVSEAVVYRNALIEIGVSSTDILLEQQSMNTYKNAEFTSTILKEKKFNRIFLVTSGIHEKRALLYFSHFGIHAIPAPSDYIARPVSLFPRGYNFGLIDYVLHEYSGIARFYLYDFLGWNKVVTKTGAP